MPDRPRLGALARLVKWGLLQWYRWSGWKAVGSFPASRKFVIVAASHTSNWDFPVFLGTVESLGVRPRFMGKDSLFRWPMKRFMYGLGGVPVDRSARKDMVQQMAERFAEEEEFALVVAAEGTRSATTKWRTGFYRIAQAAGVPIVCAGPDYPTKRAIVGPVIYPTGDFDEDMAPAFAFFKGLRPKHPERAFFPDGSRVDSH